MKRIGPYDVLEELGQGGMGVVFRAQDPRSGREVAIKRLARPGDLNARRRLRREAEALARVRHPHVVAIHTADEDDQGHPYLVMDYVAGEDLAQRLDRLGPYPAKAAAALAARLADGLTAVHAEGIVHRDLKPENVLIDQAGQPRITDFGLARDHDPGLERSRLSVTGVFLGTPAYWAPEQARGQHAAVGPRTDVYGLGAVLYHLVVGEPPQPGGLVASLDLLERPPPVPSHRRPEAAALDAVVTRCLARDPDDRYASMAEVAAALTRVETDALPRRHVPVWLPGLGALVLVALGLAAFQAGSPPAPSPSADDAAPPVEVPSVLAAPDPEARRVAALEEESPTQRYRALRAWLRDFPDHSWAAQARLHLETLTATPLLRVPCGTTPAGVMLAVDETTVYAGLNDTRVVSAWRLTGERLWSQQTAASNNRLRLTGRGPIWWRAGRESRPQGLLDGELRPFPAPPAVLQIVSSPAKDRVAISTPDEVLIQALDGQVLARWPLPPGRTVRQLAFSQDGERLVLGALCPPPHGRRDHTELAVHDATDGTLLGRADFGTRRPDALAVAPNWLVIGFQEGFVVRAGPLADAPLTLDPPAEFRDSGSNTFGSTIGGAARGLACSSDGSTLLVGNEIRVTTRHARPCLVAYDLASGRPLRYLEVQGGTNRLAACGDGLFVRATLTGAWELWGDPASHLAE